MKTYYCLVGKEGSTTVYLRFDSSAQRSAYINSRPGLTVTELKEHQMTEAQARAFEEAFS